VTYAYDTLGASLNGKGRLTSISSAVSTYGYGRYDVMGRVLSGTQTTDGQSYTMSYQYNLAGAMTSETYPSNKVVLTEYDSAGRMAGVKKNATTYYAGGAPGSANAVSYTPHGIAAAVRLGNGKWEHTTFNSRLQPVQIGLGISSADSSILRLDYGYGTTTNNGNVLSQNIVIGGTPIAQGYTYDELNRLKTASENSGASWSQTYGYDRFGNRWVSASPGYTLNALTPQSQSSFNAANNRLTASQYDAAGNQTVDSQNRTFGYDAENRQTVFNGTGGQYLYDGEGHRIKKIDSSGTTIFVYNAGGQLVAEYHSDPVPSPAGGGGTSYFTTDHLGSTRLVTDGGGAVKARYDYLPFGEELGATIGARTVRMGYSAADSTKQKFTQKERDSESGLDYFLARYYSSAQGRFTSPDKPIADQQAGDPQSWNLYPYVRNDPLKYVDPQGRQRSEMSDDRKAIAEKRRREAEEERSRRKQRELADIRTLGEKPSDEAVKIFYWAPAVLPDNDNASTVRVGHLSMMLADGTYISLFPNGAHQTYDQDVHGEGDNATRIYELSGLTHSNSMSIKAWWDGQSKDNYNGLTNNCSDVVRTALLMGGVAVHNGHGLGSAMGALAPISQLVPFSTPGNIEAQIGVAVAAQRKATRGDMRVLTLKRIR